MSLGIIRQVRVKDLPAAGCGYLSCRLQDRSLRARAISLKGLNVSVGSGHLNCASVGRLSLYCVGMVEAALRDACS